MDSKTGMVRRFMKDSFQGVWKGGRRSEVRGQRSEVGGRRSEVGSRRSEVGGQRSGGRVVAWSFGLSWSILVYVGLCWSTLVCIPKTLLPCRRAIKPPPKFIIKPAL